MLQALWRVARRPGIGVVWIAAAVCTLLGLALGQAASPPPHAAHRQTPALHREQPLHPKPPPKPYAFPAGGRTLAGAYRFVALYGTPGDPGLGVLGEQPLEQAIPRAKALADVYRPLSKEPVLPAFEIIATIASAGPTENGDYSRQVDAGLLHAWAAAARDAGVYVVLDLQPGRTDFLTQAREYESVLREPNVGLALDPEWRLTPTQVPLAQIGSVDINEVNGVADWLAGLVAAQKLPQKLFLLHQFRLDMLPGREQLHTAHPELDYIVQMDGQGAQPAKQDTWRTITVAPPANTAFGWKNFYDEDSPVLDPAAVMQLSPQPWYISYQ